MKEIILDGEVFNVRDTLWRFLHEMRKQDRRDRFWIDAICIDQMNVQERNHQVALMKDIYTEAAQVAVWLGPATSNSQLIIKKLKGASDNGNKGQAIYPIFTFSIWTPEEDTALRDLCHRDFWTRIWIIEEFILAKELTLHCGGDSLPWYHLAFFYIKAQRVRVSGRNSNLPCMKTMLASSAAQVVHQRVRKESGITPPSLTELIEAHAGMESTDVRDKVYALLGLARDIGLSDIHITADYEKSAAKIYSDFLDQCLKHHNILCGTCGSFATSLHQTLSLPKAIEPIIMEGKLINWVEHEMRWPDWKRGIISLAGTTGGTAALHANDS